MSTITQTQSQSEASEASASETLAPEQFHAAFKAALTEIRRAGVHVRQNVHNCCRSCTGVDRLGMDPGTGDTTPHAYTYGGQGAAYVWRNGLPYLANEVRRVEGRSPIRGGYYGTYPKQAQVKSLYFNHGGPGVEAATIMNEIFRAHGLDVDWNGSQFRCVVVHTPFFRKDVDQF